MYVAGCDYHSRNGPSCSFLVVMRLSFTQTVFEGGSGKLAAFTVGSLTGKAEVQVTEHSYARVQAADSLTFMNTGQIEHKGSHTETQPVERG